MRVSKKLFRLLARIAVLSPYALYWTVARAGRPQRAFQAFSQLYSLIPGVTGEYLRREFYRLTLAACSEDCVISFGTIFSSPEAQIGKSVYIGAYCVLGKVRIGENTLIASRVSVCSGLRQHGISRTDVPIREQAGEFRAVTIGEDCWIGEGSVIAADIGGHAVVGLGSVVTRRVDAYAIVTGNPATVVKMREPEILTESIAPSI